MSFSIVIPCKNEEQRIGLLLGDFVKTGFYDKEIIIADAGSTDRTLDIIEEFRSKGLRIQVIPGGLPAKGRNEGCKSATNPYVLFLDADVRLTEDFNPAFLSILCWEKRYKIVSSTPRYEGERDIKATLLYGINRWVTHLVSLATPFAIGAFTLVHKQTFLDLGGYDEEVKHTEDFLLSKEYSPKEFLLLDGWITQDNRRFKKFGYWPMVRLMWSNWVNRNNRNHFLKDVGYW